MPDDTNLAVPPWAITTLDQILRYSKTINDRDSDIEHQLREINLRLNNLQQAVLAITKVVQLEVPEIQKILAILTAIPSPPQLAGVTVVVTQNESSNL